MFVVFFNIIWGITAASTGYTSLKSGRRSGSGKSVAVFTQCSVSQRSMTYSLTKDDEGGFAGRCIGGTGILPVIS